ncbi:MAG: hypothetical protein AB7E55_25150 [Pigmentiphaga sp.]
MYEIWLGLNIAWELTLLHRWAVGGYLVLLIALHAFALARSAAAWRQSLFAAVILGLLLALVAVFALPLAADSSLANVTYLLDWLALIGLALGTGLAGGLLFWPLLALTRRGGGRLQGV